jgi:hypothetical protein
MDGLGELSVKGGIHRTMPHDAAGRILAEVVAAFPIVLRADGARAESSAAIRTHIVEQSLRTCAAEGAFK